MTSRVRSDAQRGHATGPATEQIRDDVAAAVRGAGFEPDVRMVMSPAWSTDWITPRGHDRLRAAGITPPPPVESADLTAVDLPVPCPRCGSRRTRPRSSRWSRTDASSSLTLETITLCPACASTSGTESSAAREPSAAGI